ncbi:MAG: hypothetical protein ACI4QT_10475, partial [Kiritimatiellia bacterium]
MTNLTITPDIAKKRLKLAGKVASGEKVAVTIQGFGSASKDDLQLRVMAGRVAVGVFPLEDGDDWEVDGDNLACTLNLSTEQAERFCKFGAETCVILEDTAVPQLYGVADLQLHPWIKLEDVDVPVNLDNYKVKIGNLENDLLHVHDAINKHLSDKDNPHVVTKWQIGLGNVDNTSDMDKPISTAQQKALDAKLDKADVVDANPLAEKPSNPGAGQAADAKSVMSAIKSAVAKSVSYADGIVNDAVSGLNTNIAAKLDKTEKGASGGVAELDESGKVPSSQLPSYVDDVLEYSSAVEFPEHGESGKVYVDKDTNTTYRWSGSTYVKIGSDLSLGDTASTAFRGDHGKVAYDHALQKTGNPHNVTAAQIGLDQVNNTSDADKPVSTAQANAIAAAVLSKVNCTQIGGSYDETNHVATLADN